MPALATKVTEYLDAQPSDRILDIGCGDGPLTGTIAMRLSSDAGGRIVGLDSSPSMIGTAASTVSKQFPGVATFHVHDCRSVAPGSGSDAVNSGGVLEAATYDKIFSSAALHWVLRDTSIRKSFFSDCLQLLKPGSGKLVFEMGGAGNVAETHAAFRLALAHRGLLNEQIDEADPWYFASVDWMRETLKETGFDVELVESEYRPTKLTAKGDHGEGGLEGWIRLMGAQYLQAVSEDARDEVVHDVCNAVRRCVEREDGSEWLGYVRLRAVAKRPAS